MPKRKVSSAEGQPRKSPRGDGRLPAKPAPAEVERQPQKAAGKGASSDQRVQTKGEGAAKGKQAEAANRGTKDLPTENGETKNEESPPSGEAGEKEVKSE
ncbi:Non-histone chromosomal protein HMG-14 [Tupaia chinensis]|uniref:Non-histone chromosomal protein HMG-14 n=1 Tax=Tupaia chinensis TaxID=246437 RepID=L9KKG4_TUPCH|nr:Non-histone chromosomal protein HMG-14 [Tupaia chinensis]